MNGVGDIRPIAHSLMRSPSFSLGVVLTLALGIGAVAAAFSASRGVLLTPLPHEDGASLVYLRQTALGAGVENALFSVPEIQVYRENVKSFEGVAEFSAMRMTALGLDRPRQMHVGIVTGNYFDVMGLGRIVGRVLGPGDDGEDAAAVAVLTAEYWRTEFGGDPEIVGKTMRMNARTVMIVGVAEPHPPYPERTDMLVNLVVSPHHLSATMAHGWTHRMTEVFARMTPGATLEGTAAEVRTVSAELHGDHPEAYDETYAYTVELHTLQDQLTGRARTVLLVLLATAGFVLLVSVANIANLTLARSTRLAEELAVRASLGASTTALRTRLLTENLILGLVGGLSGLGLAVFGLSLIVPYVSRFSVRASEIHLDGWTVLVSMLLALGTARVLSFAPKLPSDSLRPGARGGMGRGVKRTQRILVAAQVGASLVLVFGAGLLARTLVNLQSIDSGFDLVGVVAMDVPSVLNGRSSQEIRDDYPEMVAAIEREPGVERAAITNVIPFKAGSTIVAFRFDFRLDGADAESGAPAQRADFRTISDGFFETLGVDVVAGRNLTPGDGADAPRVAVVNETFARRYLADRDPIGHRVSWTGDIVQFAGVSDDDRTIVGVVADILDDERESKAFPAIFIPHLQEAWGSALVVRGRGDLSSLAARAADAVRGVEPDQPVEGIITLEEARRASFGDARLNAQLVGLLATLSLVIAALGIFAVLSFSVSQRTREIGIRMALGADSAHVIRRIVAESLSMVGAGVVLGLLGSIALSNLLQGLLFGVAPTDLPTLAGGTIALVVTALFASVIPAYRASKVDPARALTSD